MSGDAVGEADRFEPAPHPRHATQLFGHSESEAELLTAFQQNRLPHAIVLGGPSGIGKATLAWRLTKFLLANPLASTPRVAAATTLAIDPDHPVAAQVSALAHPDVFLLRREYNDKNKRFFTQISADDVRRAIGLFQRAAGAGGYRICIVDCAEDLNHHSANALLKMIEEPPPNALFLLVAHRPGLLLPTLRSRSRVMRMAALDSPVLVHILKSLGPAFAGLPGEDLAAAANKAKGSVHDALNQLGEQGIGLYQQVRSMLLALPSIDWRDVHRLADSVAARSGETALGIMQAAIADWLSQALRDRAGQGLYAGHAIAEAWEALASQLREVEALNLDRRPLVLATFEQLARTIQQIDRS